MEPDDLEDSVSLSKRGKAKLKRILHQKMKLNSSASNHTGKKFCGFNTSRTTILRETLRANNRALAKALEAAKKKNQELMDSYVILQDENQKINEEVRSLRQMKEITDIEGLVNKRLKEEFEVLKTRFTDIALMASGGIDACSGGTFSLCESRLSALHSFRLSEVNYDDQRQSKQVSTPAVNRLAPPSAVMAIGITDLSMVTEQSMMEPPELQFTDDEAQRLSIVNEDQENRLSNQNRRSRRSGIPDLKVPPLRNSDTTKRSRSPHLKKSSTDSQPQTSNEVTLETSNEVAEIPQEVPEEASKTPEKKRVPYDERPVKALSDELKEFYKLLPEDKESMKTLAKKKKSPPKGTGQKLKVSKSDPSLQKSVTMVSDSTVTVSKSDSCIEKRMLEVPELVINDSSPNRTIILDDELELITESIPENIDIPLEPADITSETFPSELLEMDLDGLDLMSKSELDLMSNSLEHLPLTPRIIEKVNNDVLYEPTVANNDVLYEPTVELKKKRRRTRTYQKDKNEAQDDVVLVTESDEQPQKKKSRLKLSSKKKVHDDEEAVDDKYIQDEEVEAKLTEAVMSEDDRGLEEIINQVEEISDESEEILEKSKKKQRTKQTRTKKGAKGKKTKDDIVTTDDDEVLRSENEVTDSEAIQDVEEIGIEEAREAKVMEIKAKEDEKREKEEAKIRAKEEAREAKRIELKAKEEEKREAKIRERKAKEAKAREREEAKEAKMKETKEKEKEIQSDSEIDDLVNQAKRRRARTKVIKNKETKPPREAEEEENKAVKKEKRRRTRTVVLNIEGDDMSDQKSAGASDISPDKKKKRVQSEKSDCENDLDRTITISPKKKKRVQSEKLDIESDTDRTIINEPELPADDYVPEVIDIPEIDDIPAEDYVPEVIDVPEIDDIPTEDFDFVEQVVELEPNVDVITKKKSKKKNIRKKKDDKKERNSVESRSENESEHDNVFDIPSIDIDPIDTEIVPKVVATKQSKVNESEDIYNMEYSEKMNDVIDENAEVNSQVEKKRRARTKVIKKKKEPVAVDILCSDMIPAVVSQNDDDGNHENGVDNANVDRRRRTRTKPTVNYAESPNDSQVEEPMIKKSKLREMEGNQSNESSSDSEGKKHINIVLAKPGKITFKVGRMPAHSFLKPLEKPKKARTKKNQPPIELPVSNPPSTFDFGGFTPDKGTAKGLTEFDISLNNSVHQSQQTLSQYRVKCQGQRDENQPPLELAAKGTKIPIRSPKAVKKNDSTVTVVTSRATGIPAYKALRRSLDPSKTPEKPKENPSHLSECSMTPKVATPVPEKKNKANSTKKQVLTEQQLKVEVEGGRPRRSRPNINFKEPSLNAKMRRGDKNNENLENSKMPSDKVKERKSTGKKSTSNAKAS